MHLKKVEELLKKRPWLVFERQRQAAIEAKGKRDEAAQKLKKA